MPSLAQLENPSITLATEVYGDDGTMLGKYYKEKGGADGLPIYDPNEETYVTVTYKVKGKDVTVHGKQLSDKEIQAIKDYIKTLPEKNKEDDKQ